MNANATRGKEVDEQLEERDRRALEQYLTVLPDYDRAKAADDLFMVVSESGSEYLCDVRVGACECPDHEYRDEKCKHLRRVEFATGERTIPRGDDVGVDVDPQLGEHVGTVATEYTGDELRQKERAHNRASARTGLTGRVHVPNTATETDRERAYEKVFGDDETETDSGKVTATDGGVTVREAAGDCEVTHTGDVFAGPFPEYDRYGNPTGTYYRRCRSCGREVLDDTPESAVSHRDGCRFGEQDDGPQRHEPADFGGGESTGVQDL